jgi:recombination protein RecT
MQKEIAKKEPTIHELLIVNRKKIESALPANIDINRLLSVAINEVRNNQKLQECTGTSLFNCIATSARIGLFPDNLLGEAYLVPFKDKCQLVIGYQGLLKLAYQSGQITNITAKEVRENDKFSYKYGMKPDLIHVPAAKDRGATVYYYAVATLTNGGAAFEVMSREDCEAHKKKYSKASFSPSSPWNTEFDAMAKKTVIRKLVKLLPRSTENLLHAVKLDEHAEIGTQADYTFDGEWETVPTAAPKQKKSEALVETLNSNKSEPISPQNKGFVDDLGGVE